MRDLPDGPALLNLVGLKALLPTETVVEFTGRGTETAKVVYLCELAEDVQDSITMDDDEDDECDGCDGGDSFDAAGAAADAAAAASEAPASVVAAEAGPRRGGRMRREVRRD